MTTPWTALYPPGIGATLDVRHPDMLRLWDDAVRRRGPEPGVYYGAAEFDYATIDAESEALAAALSADIAPGDRVGILLQNDPQWPVALLAAWKAGAVAVSLSPLLKARELTEQLADSGATVLICLAELYRDVVAPALPGTAVRVVLTTDPAEWSAGTPHPPPPGAASLRAVVDRARGTAAPRPRLSGVDTAVLTYTSGTTGPPKGAMLTHAGLCHNVQLVAAWFGIGADEPVLGMAPLFHVTGLVMHMGVSWYAGCPLVLGHRFDPAEIFTAIRRRRPRFTIAAITAYLALLNHTGIGDADFTSLRVAASGGAPVNLGVVQRFRAVTGLTISSVYGLTETTSPSHLTPPGSEPPVDPATGALAVGVPVPGAIAGVVDDAGAPLPPGAVGELTVAGPMVVPGYWRRPEESAAALPGGVLHTGDVAVMTDEGWFFVVDRKKDLIVASGYKVWPREVEEVLYEHPAVREAAVIGVPDEYRGETVAAWVVPVDGAEVTAQTLIAFCRERLAAYKYPRRITFVAAIPKTSSGKVLRRALREEQP